MALAKKGSQIINVDGVEYRWAVSPDSGYMWLIVQHAAEQGQRIEAHFLYEYGGKRLEITPGLVRIIILHALANGWQPEKHDFRPFRVEGENVAPHVR